MGMLQRRESTGGVVFYTSPLLQAAGVPHAFSTRRGGVSLAPFDSMNFGNPAGCEVPDDADHIAENYRRLQAAAGCAGVPVCRVHQVHGAGVAHVRPQDDFDFSTRADALVSTDASRAVSVRVADCVPILACSADGAAAAAIHAGWRGTIAGVLPAAIAALRRVHPGSGMIRAAIGPCIGDESFETGPEVLEEFDRVFGPGRFTRPGNNGKGFVNLRGAVKAQLLDAGLTEEDIDETPLCTFREKQEFFSHRRDRGLTGRMVAMIAPASVSGRGRAAGF